MYVFGGKRTCKGQTEVYDDIYAFNIQNETWTKISCATPRTLARYGHTCVALGNKIFIFGGHLADDKISNDLFVFHTEKTKWRQHLISTGMVPTGRAYHNMLSIAGKSEFWLLGGENSNEFSFVFSFDTQTNEWSLIDITFEAPLRFHTSFFVDDVLYIYGGRILQEKYENVINALWKLESRGSKPKRQFNDPLKVTVELSRLKDFRLDPKPPMNFWIFVKKTSQFQWEIDDEINLKEPIGEGLLGKVWRASLVKGGTNAMTLGHSDLQLVVKSIRETPSNSLHLQKLRELLESVRTFRHPGLIMYYGTAKFEDSTLILMEMCEGKSIKDIMAEAKSPLLEVNVATIIREVLQILVYIYKKKPDLCHRNIKASNIYLTKTGIKLGDHCLDKSLFVDKEIFLKAQGSWLAPEIVQAIRRSETPEDIDPHLYSEKSDIFAVGITMIEMIENMPPFKSLLSPTSYSDNFHDFLSKCLTARPENRQSATELLKHPFLLSAPDVSSLQSLSPDKSQSQELESLDVSRPTKGLTRSVDSLDLAIKTEPPANLAASGSSSKLWQFLSRRTSRKENSRQVSRANIKDDSSTPRRASALDSTQNGVGKVPVLVVAPFTPNSKERPPVTAPNKPSETSSTTSEKEDKKTERKTKRLRNKILDQIVYPLRSLPSQPEKSEPEESEKRLTVGPLSSGPRNEQILSELRQVQRDRKGASLPSTQPPPLTSSRPVSQLNQAQTPILSPPSPTSSRPHVPSPPNSPFSSSSTPKLPASSRPPLLLSSSSLGLPSVPTRQSPPPLPSLPPPPPPRVPSAPKSSVRPASPQGRSQLPPTSFKQNFPKRTAVSKSPPANGNNSIVNDTKGGQPPRSPKPPARPLPPIKVTLSSAYVVSQKTYDFDSDPNIPSIDLSNWTDSDEKNPQ